MCKYIYIFQIYVYNHAYRPEYLDVNSLSINNLYQMKAIIRKASQISNNRHEKESFWLARKVLPILYYFDSVDSHLWSFGPEDYVLECLRLVGELENVN